MASNISRRNFLRGATVLGGAAAVAGLAGCAANASQSETVDDMTSQSSSPSWDEEFDIVVVGGGISGLPAAIEAADQGASVVVIEKGDHTGGQAIAAGGNCTMGGGNILQQREGVEDAVEQWYEDELYSHGYRCDRDIVYTMCDRGVETPAWMEDLGMVWYTPLEQGVLRTPSPLRGFHPDANPAKYTSGGEKTGGQGVYYGICYIQLFNGALEDRNVPVYLNTRMTEIVRDAETGEVTGIEVEREDGSQARIKANQGVIVATGSWTDNNEMVARYDSRYVGDDVWGDGGVPGDGRMMVENTGDGHLAIERIGGQPCAMDFTSYLHLMLGCRQFWSWGAGDWDWDDGSNEVSNPKGITHNEAMWKKVVAINGATEDRFTLEGEGDVSVPALGGLNENPERAFTQAYFSLEQPRNVWVIGDSVAAEELGWDLDTINNPDVHKLMMLDPELVAVADSLDELAEKMGMDGSRLAASIDRYNGFAENGVDEDYGKEGPFSKISTAPFYGFKVQYVRHTVRNGVRVNTKMQVVDGLAQNDPDRITYSCDELDVIPNLYAIGECANLFGYRRVHNTLLHYVTVGRIAAQAALGK